MSSETVNAKLFDAAGHEKGVVALSAALFAAPVKAELIHTAVRWQRAKARAGTHATLTRSEIKGGAKKPWKQKGTGRARAGSSVSPLWVGGAIVHGPQPRNYEFRFPKKMKQGALASALTVKALNDAVFVVENIESASGKTKDALLVLKALGVSNEKTLVIVPNEQSEGVNSFIRSVRNLSKIKVVAVIGVNVYDVMDAKKVVCIKAALPELESRIVVAERGA